ncbi:MAG: GNAT family N-acetyltransferase [Akkermansia sp.]|nr:GNAT family N-acetyltransferase [Akkermansia sp.]
MSNKPLQIALRPWRAEDAPRLAQLVNDKRVLANLAATMPFPYTEENAVQFITRTQQPGSLQFAIAVDGEPVGNIGATERETEFELGYWIGHDYWNRGIATRAVALLLAKIRPTAKRIKAHVFAFNPASAKVLRNNGFNKRSGYQLEPSFQGPQAPIFIYDLPLFAQ